MILELDIYEPYGSTIPLNI